MEALEILDMKAQNKCSACYHGGRTHEITCPQVSRHLMDDIYHAKDYMKRNGVTHVRSLNSWEIYEQGEKYYIRIL